MIPTMEGECGPPSRKSRKERIANEILMHFRNKKKSAQDIYISDPIDTDKDGNTLTLQDIMGGVRSACTYVGAHKLKELTKRTTFVRVS